MLLEMFQLHSDQRKSNRIDPLADPGFSRRGAPTLEFGKIFAENCLKNKEKGDRQ